MKNLHLSDRFCDVRVAFAFLTRFPVFGTLPDGRALMDTSWAFPLVGLAVAGAATLTGGLCLLIGAPSLIAALLAVTTTVILTGALHEDGLADTVDGFWGGYTAERRLEIMRDSHIGSYGVIALILGLGIRVAALSTSETVVDLASMLVVTEMASRAAMPFVTIIGTPASLSGSGRTAGQASNPQIFCGVFLTLLVTTLLLPVTTVVGCLVSVFIVTMLLNRLAHRKIDGYTGDTLGATQQVTAICCLIFLSTLQD